MCRFDRNTARRGRAAVPRTFFRTRRCRRTRCSGFVSAMERSLLRRLAGLAADVLIGVPDALALVRLGLANLADVGRDLADQLLVEAAHDDALRLRDLERHTFGRLDAHGVREADRELDRVRALRLGAVADADDLELTREAVRHALDHVRDQAALQAVQRTIRALVVCTRNHQRVAVARHLDIADDVVLELTLRALHTDVRPADRDLDAARHGDRLF